MSNSQSSYQIDHYDQLSISVDHLHSILIALTTDGCYLSEGFHLPHRAVISLLEIAENLTENIQTLIRQSRSISKGE